MTSSKSKVFLSYARNDDEPFVARLYRDLTSAGFDVWFDRVSLPSRGLTFHQEIRDAIAARERLLLVVGPKAASSEYVQQEWQFALEADKVVTPILRVGDYPLVPDELKLLHCEDFRDDDRFEFHLDNLARQLSEPPPRLGKLIAVPSLPPHYLARTERLKALRDAVRADLDRPVVLTGETARVGMHGMGGIGKSVLAAALVRDRLVREAFPDGIVWVGLGSLPTITELQRRVHRDLGGDGAIATEHEGKTKLKELLCDKAVLLILDDVWRRSDVDAFDVLGPRCRALVTTRDAGLLTALGGTHHVVELLTDTEARRLLAVAAGVPEDELPEPAAAVVSECGRLPLAVALCGGMVRAGRTWGEVLGQLEQARIDRIADRHAVEPQHQSVWHAIHVSVEFLRADTQLRYRNACERFLELGVFPPDESTPDAAVATLWSHTDGLDHWDSPALLLLLCERSLVQLSLEPKPTGDTPVRRISLHDLVYDYLQRAAGDMSQRHATLLTAYERRCPDGWWSGPNDGYFFDHLRNHLAAAGRGGELANLLHELRWLQAKHAAGLVFDLPHDFQAAIAALPEEDDRRRILRLLDEAQRRDIHFIARHANDYPQGLFQCLWNSCWWYDCPEAAQHYVEPEGGWKEPPPWQQPLLSPLLEQWRTRPACGARFRGEGPGEGSFPWLRALRPPPVHLGTAQRAVLRGHENDVTSVSWSPDGARLASGSWDKTVRVWDAASGRELACLRGHEHWVMSVSWSPDGARLASGSRDQTVRVWDAASGRELACLRGHERGVESVSWSPDGARLASGSQDKTVQVWDAASGRELACLRGHEHWVMSVSWSPDGARLASGSGDKTVRVWDVASGRELACLRGYGKAVTSVSWSPDGARLASGSEDKTVRIWDAVSGRELACLRGHGRAVTSASWSPDGTRLASGSADKTVRVWDAASGRELACLRGHESWVSSASWSPDGARLAIGMADKTVRMWDAASGRELACLRRHERVVTSVSWSPDGARLASISADKTVRVWDAVSGRELACLRGHQRGEPRVSWSRDGARLASISAAKTVEVWDAASGRELACLRGHESCVRSVSWSPDGARLASGSDDDTVRVWDAASGRELACLRGHKSGVCGVSWSADGARLASGSDDKTVRVWDAASGCVLAWLRGRELACLYGHEHRVWNVSWSPDGARLASGSWDKTVRVWDAASGRELACLRGHEGIVWSVSWSPDGARLASGSGDKTVRVWDANTFACLEVIQATGDVVAIAAGAARFPFRAWQRDQETVVEDAATGRPVAFFPVPLDHITTHPAGRAWAGASASHVYIIKLEGGQ